MIELITSWGLFVLILLAAWHFFYESAYAPNWRLMQRLEIFAIRDAIRSYMSDTDDPAELEAAKFLQDKANATIAAMAHLSLPMLVDANTIVKQNSADQKKANYRREVIAASSSELIREWNTKLTRISAMAVFVNHGGWLIYLVPIAVLVAMFKWTRASVQQLISLPLDSFNRINRRWAADAPA